jgi:glycosyltransferase involved in cell wall biosynthesis
VRGLFGLPVDKKLILFGAMNAFDERKGFKHLINALKLLQGDREVVKNSELVVFGTSRPQNELDKMFKTHYLGKLSDELTISLAYSACDAFVAPSTQDNLPNTVIESLASGVPVVAFNIGGMPDMITTGYNGYLAEPFSAEGLAKGIATILNDGDALGKNAREKAIQNFTPSNVAEQYQRLYSGLLH